MSNCDIISEVVFLPVVDKDDKEKNIRILATHGTLGVWNAPKEQSQVKNLLIKKV